MTWPLRMMIQQLLCGIARRSTRGEDHADRLQCRVLESRPLLGNVDCSHGMARHSVREIMILVFGIGRSIRHWIVMFLPESADKLVSISRGDTDRLVRGDEEAVSMVGQQRPVVNPRGRKRDGELPLVKLPEGRLCQSHRVRVCVCVR